MRADKWDGLFQQQKIGSKKDQESPCITKMASMLPNGSWYIYVYLLGNPFQCHIQSKEL